MVRCVSGLTRSAVRVHNSGNTKDMEFDLVYVNGDNNLENLKKDEDTWKVRLIEEEFARLMFDVQDV
jgi:adenine-specific DNA-methyltransferase